MKTVGSLIFAFDGQAASARPRRAFARVNARDMGLPESWFRDAIHADPELVIGPCREAGRVLGDEVWLPWGTEVLVDAGPIDVLLLSSRGRVAVIETKLSYNPERRRTVVAQVLDYAFALQDTLLEDLPAFPAGDYAPDPSDVEDCLASGRFLLVIAGDAMDPRALRLSEGLLGRHLTAEWDLAMVDLNLFRSVSNVSDLLVVPELRGVVAAQVRQVVKIKVEGTTPSARIEVERVVSEDPSAVRRGKLTFEAFLEEMQSRAPHLVADAKQVLEGFREVERESSGLITVDLQTATANLYLETPIGRKRFVGLNTEGRFRIILRYLAGRGLHDMADIIRRQAAPTIRIRDGQASSAVWLGEVGVEEVLGVLRRVRSGLVDQRACPDSQ